MSKVPLPSLHHPVETGRTGLVHCFLPAYPLWLLVVLPDLCGLALFSLGSKKPLSRGVVGPVAIFQAPSYKRPHIRVVMGPWLENW